MISKDLRSKASNLLQTDYDGYDYPLKLTYHCKTSKIPGSHLGQYGPSTLESSCQQTKRPTYKGLIPLDRLDLSCLDRLHLTLRFGDLDLQIRAERWQPEHFFKFRKLPFLIALRPNLQSAYGHKIRHIGSPNPLQHCQICSECVRLLV